jgi:hypothetical protein
MLRGQFHNDYNFQGLSNYSCALCMCAVALIGLLTSINISLFIPHLFYLLL